MQTPRHLKRNSDLMISSKDWGEFFKECVKKLNKYLYVFVLVFVCACQSKVYDEQKAMIEMNKECADRISFTSGVDNNDFRNIEYDLDKTWKYSKERVRTLYRKDFFFLLQKDVTFTNISNNQLDTRISCIYSCSGVPPHIIILERNYFTVKKNTGKINLIKTEVWEDNDLKDAPTEADETMDVLYQSIKSEQAMGQ